MSGRELKEVESTLDNISNLLFQAQKPAAGLATQFGKSVSESKQLEVLMRFLSGSPAWRFLNKMKAVALMINEWNEGLNKHNEQLREGAKIYAEEISTHKNLIKLKTDLETIDGRRKVFQSDMYKGLKDMYGEEYALAKMREMADEGIVAQTNKMEALAKVNIQNRDLLASLSQNKGAGPEDDATRERLQKEGQRRGLGKVGADGKWVENSGFAKFFTTKFAGFRNFFTTVGSFVKKIGKMAWSYLTAGVKLIGMGLLYVGLIILGIMLLKPFFVAIWDAWKEIQERGGLFFEVVDDFVSNFMERFADFGGALSNFFSLLFDKEATFKETFVAFVKMVASGWILVIGTLADLLLVAFVFLLEASVAILGGIGILLHEGLMSIWGKAVNWFKAQIWDGKSWWQKALGLIMTVLGAYAGAIIASNMISSVNPYVVAAGVGAGVLIGGALGVMGASVVSGMATGGIAGRGGKYLVGERGPEIVSLPRGAKVTPNHQIRNTGGNTINVHVSGRVGASDQEIRDIARKVGAQVSREINRTTSSGVRL